MTEKREKKLTVQTRNSYKRLKIELCQINIQILN